MNEHDNQNPEAEWFGFEKVAPEVKTQRVKEVFSSVAENYDLMNDLMSAGMHRLWKNHLISRMKPKAGEVVLDVAGGTGDVALRCVKEMSRRGDFSGSVTVCDINPDMLRVGRQKAMDAGWVKEISWVTGSAEALPIEKNSVDLACISFGLRNVTHIDAALEEFARVLKPGGRFFCMEFSPGVMPAFKKAYDLYSFSVLPWLGQHVAKDRASYQYLAESIRQFPDQVSLAARMQKAGFSQVQYEDLMGGIAVVHNGLIL